MGPGGTSSGLRQSLPAPYDLAMAEPHEDVIRKTPRSGPPPSWHTPYFSEMTIQSLRELAAAFAQIRKRLLAEGLAIPAAKAQKRHGIIAE